MKDGVLRIGFTEGKADRIQVGTALAQTYEKLFRSARRQARSRQSREIGVKVIVFGCLWLEALCNGCVRDTLERSPLPQSLRVAVVDAIERAPIRQKLTVLSAYQAPEQATLVKNANQLFELRNQPVHFGEQLEEVDGAIAIETITKNAFGQLQETRLVKKLKPPALDTSIKDILLTKRWLDQVKGEKRMRGAPASRRHLGA
ncbi:MAG TPA: hypothetical protein VNK23_12410 [Candidatus Dormibacteraeota bacterium]|nr:hypothetical protein [Candidatus Dormibacteraeota bacterium]